MSTAHKPIYKIPEGTHPPRNDLYLSSCWFIFVIVVSIVLFCLHYNYWWSFSESQKCPHVIMKTTVVQKCFTLSNSERLNFLVLSSLLPQHLSLRHDSRTIFLLFSPVFPRTQCALPSVSVYKLCPLQPETPPQHWSVQPTPFSTFSWGVSREGQTSEEF